MGGGSNYGGSNQLIITFTNENTAVWWEFAKAGTFTTKNYLGVVTIFFLLRNILICIQKVLKGFQIC